MIDSTGNDIRDFFMEAIPNSILDIGDLMKVEIPERTMIMSPWLASGQVNVLHAPKGVGKTFFAMSLAIAITHKYDFRENWITQNHTGVLYIDGEVSIQEFRDRLLALRGDKEQVAPLSLLSSDYMSSQSDAYMNLSDENVRKAVLGYLNESGQYGVVFLDNKSSLCPYGDENTKQDFDGLNQWMLELKRNGYVVFLIHHSNKRGDMRGTSAIADNPEYILKMREHKSAKQHGCTVVVHFDKNRGIFGADADDFLFKVRSEIEVQEDGYQKPISSYWEVHSLASKKTEDEVNDMLKSGLSAREIADAIDCDVSTVYRAKKKLKGKDGKE